MKKPMISLSTNGRAESTFYHSEPRARKGLNKDWEKVTQHENGDHSIENGVDPIRIIAAAEAIHQRIIIDPVTECFNRSYLDKFKEQNFNQELSHNKIGFIFIDLNDFKIINDEAGHLAGDKILSELVVFLRQFFRKSDEIVKLIDDDNENDVVRFGGDEFVIICHNNNNDENFEDNLLLKIQEIINKPDKPVNFSCGVAVFDKNLDQDLDDTIKRADENMYSNKKEVKRKSNSFLKKIKKIIRIIFDGS